MSLPNDLPLVIALVAQNENQALRAASDALGQAFSKNYRYRIIDLCAAHGTRNLVSALKEDKVAFAYGFAGVGSQLLLNDGVNLWTAARVPFAALWYDHPCYNYKQHIVDSPYVFHCYHVRDHIEARQKHLPASSGRAVLVSPPYETYLNSITYSLGCRTRPILYAKTALSPTLWIDDWRRHPPSLQTVLYSLADKAVQDRNLDLADAAKTLFEQAKIPTDNLDKLMGVIQEVDAYVRAWRSDRLAHALLPHPAHILGRGWDYLHDQPRKAVFIPPVPASEYIRMSWDFKIIANSNPLWRDGFHERVWGGMISGALTVTDRTVKADAMLGDLPSYLGFEWQDDLEDVIAKALLRSREDDAEYYQSTNRILADRALTGYDGYVKLIAEEAERTRCEAI